jgi:hypothetical protein
MEVRCGGAWRTITTGEAFVNGAWRTLRYGEAYIDGAWKQVATFVQPLTLSVSPPSTGANAGATTTPSVTATPSGGLGPFTYSWAKLSGDAVSANSPSLATTSFTLTSGSPPANATFRCTVTDALGSTATADVGVLFSNASSGGGTL